jgi:Flp pilus assembly protein TadD
MVEDGQAAESAGEPKKQDLHSRHVDDFVTTSKRDPGEALQRFGFTVWHSLPAEEAAALKGKLELQPLEAVDYYNRGTSRAREGDFAGAETDLRTALRKDPGHALALFNLAVCLERLGRVGEARQAYEQYIEMLDRVRGRTDLQSALGVDISEEKARIRQHLDSLGR